MSNTYKPVSDRAKALHGEGIVELDLSPSEEKDELVGGHLEIAPRAYKVLSANYSAGKQGDEVSLALPVEIEAALISGSHLERVAHKPAATKKKG